MQLEENQKLQQQLSFDQQASAWSKCVRGSCLETFGVLLFDFYIASHSALQNASSELEPLERQLSREEQLRQEAEKHFTKVCAE